MLIKLERNFEIIQKFSNCIVLERRTTQILKKSEGLTEFEYKVYNRNGEEKVPFSTIQKTQYYFRDSPICQGYTMQGEMMQFWSDEGVSVLFTSIGKFFSSYDNEKNFYNFEVINDKICVTKNATVKRDGFRPEEWYDFNGNLILGVDLEKGVLYKDNIIAEGVSNVERPKKIKDEAGNIIGLEFYIQDERNFYWF